MWLIKQFQENEKQHNTDVQGLMESYNEKFFGAPPGWEGNDDGIDVELPEQRIYFDEEDDFSFVPDDYGSGLPKDPEELFNEMYQQEFQNNENAQRPLYLQTNDIPKDVAVGGNAQPVMYTEGGMVYAPNSDGDGSSKSNIWDTNFGRILEKFNLGFKRPERLDVKKPGPRFDDIDQKPYGIHTIH